jgi:hypothetical protein
MAKKTAAKVAVSVKRGRKTTVTPVQYEGVIEKLPIALEQLLIEKQVDLVRFMSVYNASDDDERSGKKKFRRLAHSIVHHKQQLDEQLNLVQAKLSNNSLAKKEQTRYTMLLETVQRYTDHQIEGFVSVFMVDTEGMTREEINHTIVGHMM